MPSLPPDNREGREDGERGYSLRVGIFGGTFDPIHLGHLRVAEEVGEELELEKVYLIPAALPPHKEIRPITPFHDRLKMIQLATKDSPCLEPMDLEGRRQGLSYTIETLKELHSIFPHSPEFFFILGMDAFLEIETWKEYELLFDYCHFVVIERPGFQAEKLESFLISLNLGFGREDRERIYRGPHGMTVICKQATLMDISSTRIREAIRSGKSIRFLVPDSVMMYIREEGLYIR